MGNSFKREGAPQTITVSSSASSPRKLTDNPDSVRIVNLGTAAVWFNFGGPSVTVSTTTGQAIGPGVHEVQRPDYTSGPLYVSVIAAGSTGDIQFTPGSGL